MEKKYATELPEGKGTGSVLAEDAVVSVKQIIISDLSQNSKNKRKKKRMGISESLFQVHLSPRSSLFHKV